MNKKLLTLGVIAVVLIVAGFYFFKNSEVQNNNTKGLTKISLALDWFPYAMHAGLYVAKERSYFADEGLDVDIHVPANVATIPQTVAQGRDTFGLSTEPDVLIARSEGIPIVSIAALTQHPLSALTTLAESGLKRPRDLKGKRIGYAGLPLETVLYDTMLKFDGVQNGIEDVQFTNVGYDALTGLLAGQLDAISSYYTNQPIIAENQGRKVNTMKAVDYGVPDYYDLVIVTNEDTIKNNPDLAERFLRAATKGYKEATLKPQDAISLMARSNPELDTAVANKEILLETPVWIADNGVFGWQEESKWVGFAQWMKDGSLLTKPVDAQKAFTNSFIESLK